MKLVWNNISASVFKMKWKCNSVQGCGNGCSQVWTIVMILQIISAACVVLVASEGENTPADSVADEVSHFSQV
jgi:Na+/H+ antiporter NhaC